VANEIIQLCCCYVFCSRWHESNGCIEAKDRAVAERQGKNCNDCCYG